MAWDQDPDDAPGPGQDLEPEVSRDPLTTALLWGRVVIGAGAAVVGAVAAGGGFGEVAQHARWLGAGALVLGFGLAASAIFGRASAPARVRQAPAEPVEPREPLVPLLGALLVYKYRLISHQQLERALEDQRRTRRLLGEIMVDLGMISRSQLREAIEHQRLLMEEKRARPPSGQA